MFDEYDDYSGFMFTPEAADYGGVMNLDYLYDQPSYLDFNYSDYQPSYMSYNDMVDAGLSSSLFSPDSLNSMLESTYTPSYDTSTWAAAEPSFRTDDFLALTPEAGAAGGIYGTSPTDFMNISELISPSLAQTELLSVNPFSGENDSWMSSGFDYLNPDLNRLGAILGVLRGDTSFRDASGTVNDAYDFARREVGSLPTSAQSSLAKQIAKAEGKSSATGALEKALKAAELATLLYKAGTAKQGVDKSEFGRRDKVEKAGPSFERAQATRGARGYKEGGPIKGGLLPVIHRAAEEAHRRQKEKEVPGGQDDVIELLGAPGEYMLDAETVAALGDGSNEAGAAKLDKMRRNLRKHKRGGSLDKIPPRAKSIEEYLED